MTYRLYALLRGPIGTMCGTTRTRRRTSPGVPSVPFIARRRCEVGGPHTCAPMRLWSIVIESEPVSLQASDSALSALIVG